MVILINGDKTKTREQAINIFRPEIIRLKAQIKVLHEVPHVKVPQREVLHVEGPQDEGP